MFQIEIAPDANQDLQWFRKHEGVRIIKKIETHLRHQPDVETRKRKRLRPGHKSQWELRLGNARVFYDVDVESAMVKIVAIGVKDRNRLYFRGQEHAHEEDDDS